MQRNRNLVRRAGPIPPTRAPVFYNNSSNNLDDANIGNDGIDLEDEIADLDSENNEDGDLDLNNGLASTPTRGPQPEVIFPSNTPAPAARASTPTSQAILHSNTSVHARAQAAQPASLGKRKSPSATQPSADNIRIIKTIKSEPSGTRNRLIAKDLPSMFQGILADAQGHFRSMASTFSGFPDAMMAQEFATDAWHKSCKNKGVAIEFEEEFCRLVCV